MLRDEGGYTLLEVLVAVSLIALMALPISDSLNVGIRAWFSAHEKVDQGEQRLLVRRRLESWIGSAYPGDAYLLRRAPLLGAEDQLSFIAPVHPDAMSDDMYAVVLKKCGSNIRTGIVPNFQATALMDQYGEITESSEEDALDDLDPPGFLEELACDDDHFAWTTLIGNVDALSFSYMARNTETGEPIWHARWNVDVMNLPWNAMPEAVRITIAFHNADADWPDLTIPLVVADQAYCELDRDSGRAECAEGALPG